MKDVYATALQNSTYMKKYDKEKKLPAGQCLDRLEEGDKVLVRNLEPKGASGNLR